MTGDDGEHATQMQKGPEWLRRVYERIGFMSARRERELAEED